MKPAFKYLLIGGIALSSLAACKKDDDDKDENADPATVKKEIVTSLANNVILPTYADMGTLSNTLYTAITTFNANSTDANLQACRNAWLSVRNAWESSEGFLFGPVATNNIDPRIDTWPVNYVSLDSVLQNQDTYTNAYIESLEDALRGFHPIEYLIFGQDGTKTAADFTPRQKDYLLALAENLKGLCNQVTADWNATYTTQFLNPGSTSVYTTQREVYEEVVNAIIGICDEVANGKIKEPFDLKDPSLEESPFALNSIKDFTNNMHSVENIYFGKYSSNDGRGLEDLVKIYNLSLHNKISQQIQAAIQSLNNITMPFGQAINGQATQVQNSIDAINTLKGTLEDELLPLVQTYTE